jgi:phosphopantetheine--protein transferase-like protein
MFPTNLDNASRDQRMVDILGPEELKELCAEVAFGRTREKSDAKLNVFMGGRIAMRGALYVLYKSRELYELMGKIRLKEKYAPTGPPPPAPILSNQYGAPILPFGFVGSISHKKFYAAAVAMNMHPMFCRAGHIGVDIESCTNKASKSLAKRLFSKDELASLDGLGGLVPIEEEILLRFSFKESIFKALHPILKRHIEFLEAEVYPKPGGKVKIIFKLRSGEQFSYRAEWRRVEDNFWLTCVHAWPYVEPAPARYNPFDHGVEIDAIE